MIRSKNQAYKAWLSRPTRAKRIAYEKKRRLTDKLRTKKKGQKLNEHLLRITEEFNKNGLHKVFKEVRSYGEGFKPSTELCKDVQGNTGDCTKIRQRWREYFEGLLNGNSNDEEGEIKEFSEANEDLHSAECPTLEEVKRCFRCTEKPQGS
jgi:hypothetical protein